MPLDRLSTRRLDDEPAAEREQQRQARAVGRLPAAPAPVAEHEQREREQAGERERQQPRALVAEAAAEQPQRAGRAAEGDRVALAAVGQQFGLFRAFGRGVRLGRFAGALAFARRRPCARRRRVPTGICPGPPVCPPTRPKPL